MRGQVEAETMHAIDTGLTEQETDESDIAEKGRARGLCERASTVAVQ